MYLFLRTYPKYTLSCTMKESCPSVIERRDFSSSKLSHTLNIFSYGIVRIKRLTGGVGPPINFTTKSD